MKEKFKQLYDYIISSEDEEKMHVLGSVTKGMMCYLIDNNPRQAKEYLEKLESVKWVNYLTREEAQQIVGKMEPAAWNRNAWESAITQLKMDKEEEGIYNEDALYVTMCMIYSDSGATIKEMLAELQPANMDNYTEFRFIYRLALNKLKDADGVFHIREYFKV